ncbi:hypothetical protein AXE80_08855 [Wenyingzhuangia fucanilytica]|uniref:Glycoside-hydrolase family GH114 TIM-barrel domain-containing protein n=2 Tax=Wenyingzhuangia fucanilytica TaxID=1790137 RepID=A0A1B1Y6K9_9FLAO|nr:hypothetical protein AXE80_08855 [Wenyingzhuangia fucanilytica]
MSKTLIMKAFLKKFICLGVIFLLSLSVNGQSKTNKDYYPEFSWKTVPVAFHFAKRNGLMTDKELDFVTSHSNFIVLEKGHGGDIRTEKGIDNEAQRIKDINPKAKVVFYWNAFLDYNLYDAHKEYENHKEWWLKKLDGNYDYKSAKVKRYDLSNPAFRKWWVSIAKKAVVDGHADGVFMDAFIQVINKGNIELWGQKKYDAIQQGLKDLIAETRAAIGEDHLIVYNGIRSIPNRNVGNDFPEHTDAVMIEHFANFQSKSKESMLQDILEMEKAGKTGKIVVFKAWPNEHSWIDKNFMAKPLQEKRKIARANITFPLAAFLAGAQENSYFIYNWGYRMDDGGLEWYPELDKSLGKPLNEMKVHNWELTRNYEHASVWLNLATKEAKINWK